MGICVVCTFISYVQLKAQQYNYLLDDGWHTAADSFHINAFPGFQDAGYNAGSWKRVSVPHNWDDYGGYVRLLHGNRHGYAFYRKTFKIKAGKNKEIFLWFEGVGSYATVWLNGKKVGYHAGGRTSFTIDISKYVYRDDRPNTLAVRADHPAGIAELPWVCGGCSSEPGFSEGSQPMGIFRPVHLIVTGKIKVQPFGVHIWNDTTVNEKNATLYLETEIKNYDSIPRKILLINKLIDRDGKQMALEQKNILLKAGEIINVKQIIKNLSPVKLWSLEHPYLYHLVTQITDHHILSDNVVTSYGIRWISWPIGKARSSNRFLLNGKPVFINGIAEYEHALGQSHAFSPEEIKSRAVMIGAAGFNAFRDAHQPHNLLYQKYWDSLGVLWWPQFSAHIWFDTPAFRQNFISLLKDWVKERRNSPSLILWGLQNESHLPADFGKQCVAVIRSLDPTASSQRLITTCNGGEGTDWNVPQNWTGTYGGDPATYASDLKKQILVGEYGGWRTIDLHQEDSSLNNTKLNSESKWCNLIEQKIGLAESVRGSVCGHFFWLFNSHDNPGRVQSGEGYRELDAIGPVNYKGLLTSWEEPTDAYYLFRANYASKFSSPLVYIVSHTWPDRWLKSDLKSSIDVYSNCDSVTLFNDVDASSFGMKKNPGRGKHFIWKDVPVRYNVLYAVGYVDGKVAARDTVVLHHLPEAPHFRELYSVKGEDVIQPDKGYKYVYRVNCGGPDYKDSYGNVWKADRQLTGNGCWGSQSWTMDYPGVPPFFASQRRITNPIRNTYNWPLFQTFRYGRGKLRYIFPLPDGDYRVELYFAEPWWGAGDGMDCSGFRLFDVSVNNRTVLGHFDIWKSAGAHAAVRRTFDVHVTNGKIVVSFPRTESGQAVIAAIAIASKDNDVVAAPSSKSVIDVSDTDNFLVKDWMDTGDTCYRNGHITFNALPPKLFGAQWLYGYKQNKNNCLKIKASQKATIYVGLTDDAVLQALPGFTNTGTFIETDEAGGAKLSVYEKTLERNDTLCIDPRECGIDNCIIAATPFSGMQPAFDLKAVSIYTVAAAGHYKGFAVSNIDDRRSLEVAEDNAALDWKISLGVADYYSFGIKYANHSRIPVDVHWQILSTEGQPVDSGTVVVQTSSAGKWPLLEWRTRYMINAGNYLFRLTIRKKTSHVYIASVSVK